MRCKTCDHSLWNQPAPPAGQPRVCSECGAPYTAADFDFGRGKVRFCCPTCSTGYYGTTARGHLEPAEFRCVGCGSWLNMDRCVIRAHDMEHEGEAMQQVEVPWIESRKSGSVGRWGRTVKVGLGNSGALVAGLARPPRPIRAAAFVLVNGVVGVAPTIVAIALGPGLRGGWIGPPGSPVDQIVVVLAAVAMTAVALALFAALPALFCGLLTRKGEPIGIGRAYEISAYSSAALVTGVVPCCGFGLAGILWTLQSARGFEAALAGEPLAKRVAASLLTIAGFAGAVVATLFLLSAL